MKRCHWVEPVLVAQFKFTEWTSDDQLRQPVFLELRTDKQAKEVVRESISLLVIAHLWFPAAVAKKDGKWLIAAMAFSTFSGF